MRPKSSVSFANRLCVFAAASFVGLASPALADTENDIWKVTVMLQVPGVADPFETAVFRNFGQAEAAMKGGHADAAFLSQISQNASESGSITSSYEILPEDLATWRPWQYQQHGGGPYYSSEAQIIAIEMQADVCGSGSMAPTSGWTWFEGNAIYERERRTFDKITTHPTSIPTPPYTTCSPYTTQTFAYTMTRIRYLKCPAGAPWYERAPLGDGLCHNATVGTITDNEPHQACVAEEDGADPIDGNPCNASTGNKLQVEPDYAGPELSFVRAYNSLTQVPTDAGLGDKWTHNYASRLVIYNGVPSAWLRQDGELELMLTRTSTYRVGERSAVQLLKTGSDWDLHLRGGATHRYSGTTGRLLWIKNAAGQQTTLTYGANGLETVTGPFGHELGFEYADGQLVTVTDPDGGTYDFTFDDDALTSVTYPDSTVRTYHYEDGDFSQHLTGITDENGDRFSTYAYDDWGRAVLTEHAGGYEKYTLVYNSNATTTVTDALANSRTYQFTSVLWSGLYGRRQMSSSTQGGQSLTRTYAQGYTTPHRPLTSTNENGVQSSFSYDATNFRRTARTQAVGTSNARTTTFQYLDSQRDLLTEISAPGVSSGQRKLITAYDSNQLPTTITLQGYTPSGGAVSRSIGLSYNSARQVTQINGPRTDLSDVTTLTYYACASGGECGQLESATNALGHETTFDVYDDHGRLLEMADPNGVVTEYAYDLRGHVTSISETPPSSTARVTTYTYDDAGQLETVEAPNGTILTYDYDAAHNLLSITDNLGNSIGYGYDLNGNRTSEDIRDSSSALRKTVDYTFDVRNRLDSINAAGSTTEFVFDALGNLTDAEDPNSNDTGHDYDQLNRLTSTLDALSGVTEYGYNKNDQLTSVEAPNGATTTYVYDDLGNLLSQTSPDTGTTTYTYDAAGNRLSQTDARSITVNYAYDALNRLTSIDYPGSSLDTTLTYDQGTAQKGRLTTMTDGAGSTTFAYDAVGNLTEESKTIDGNTHVTAYSYDAADLLTEITYPSGRTVSYTRNVLGQVTSVATSYGGSGATVASSVAYEPFGPLKALTFGNSQTMSRAFDQQYRLTDQTTGSVQDLGFTLDAVGNIDAITDGVNGGLSQGFAQDMLHRVTTDAGAYGTKNYTYDSVGNRLTRTHGAATQTLTYTANSNRLATHDGQTISLDATGNTLGNPAENLSFTYGAHNRQLEVYAGGVLKATFVYNGQGQRIKKVEATGAQRTFIYHYGQGGELLGETVYSSAGAKIGERDYLWLEPLPLAQSERTFSGGSVTSSDFVYVHADQLDTPRLATNASGTIVWRWDSDAFGLGAANQDPDGDTNLVNIRLRFPGQYLDEETGLHYNYFRDYDPVTGRYVQSDPIGLDGGINTYAYGGGNPIGHVDPLGLAFTSVDWACARDPFFCREILGQMMDNAVTLSGDACLQEEWRESSEKFDRVVKVAAVAAAVVGGVAATRAIAQRFAARGSMLFGQASVRSTFAYGPHAGRTIGEVAQGLRAGTISAETLPIDYVVRSGQAIALNNRSLLALTRAGMQPTVTRNLTGNQAAEALLNSHLQGGVPSTVIRVRGGPPGTSLIE